MSNDLLEKKNPFLDMSGMSKSQQDKKPPQGKDIYEINILEEQKEEQDEEDEYEEF